MVRFTNLWIFLYLLIGIRHIHMQPVTCIDDSQCSMGFFCHSATHACHECLSCEYLGRSPAPIENACIKSGHKCGPCFQGLINVEFNHWSAMCVSPETKSLKILSSYICILIICVATGVLLSLFIVHGIWNTHIINVNIAVSKTISPQLSDTVFTNKETIARKA